MAAQRREASDAAQPETVRVVDLYEAAPKIHPRTVDGPLVRLRAGLRYGLVAATMLGPWLTWDDRQALLLDLPARQFHVFGLTFFPQDFILVAGLLIVGAFALFTVTNWLGRVWCGYSCPQSVWFQAFIDIEAWIEGPRHRRIRQDKAAPSISLRLMKLRKWSLWLLLAAATGVSIVGYFAGIRPLTAGLLDGTVGGWTLFWVVFLSTATLVMGAIMREQVCLYMCPYARFQSAMFDTDTLIVSYDAARGEPRGARKRGADVDALPLGACVDCELCVQVCPVGIDIRDGLQYECISCAHCVDACDGVMERMGYAPGLVAYTTERALAGEPEPRLRPRLLGYGAVLATMVLVFATLAASRGIAELDVLRDRGALSQAVWADGIEFVENAYRLRIVNKRQAPATWEVSVRSPDGGDATPLEIHGARTVTIDAGAVIELPLRVRSRPREDFATAVEFELRDGETTVAREESRFVFGRRET